MPLTKARTLEPLFGLRSEMTASTMIATTSLAEPSAARRRPGSPWMPTPSSIWPSGSSKIALPEAGGTQDESATPNERERSLTRLIVSVTLVRSAPDSAAAPAIFSASTVAPTPRGVERVRHGHVVVDDDRGALDALVRRVFGGELEVQDVARVVLDDVDDARASVDRLGGREHLRGDR